MTTRRGRTAAPVRSRPRVPAFGSIGIVGLGLIGGSLALALRRAWPSAVIVGVDRRAVVTKALAAGAIDQGGSRLALLASVDLVVLAAPVAENVRLLRRLASILGPAAIVTDVGSTKRAIARAAARQRGLAFVGGHPMAGATTSGIDAADATLFRGRPWVLTTDTAEPSAVRRIAALARAVGARPVVMSAADHDRVAAFVSHLPQLVASVLMGVVGDSIGAPGLRLAGPGLRDTTRLAASPTALWKGICRANRDHIDAALGLMIERLVALRSGRLSGRVLSHTFTTAQAWRRTLERTASSS
jgi:prephenate dehydrogenase